MMPVLEIKVGFFMSENAGFLSLKNSPLSVGIFQDDEDCGMICKQPVWLEPES